MIPYGIDLAAYRAAPAYPVLQPHSNHPKAVKALFVGRLVYYKGVTVLLRAMQQVQNCELFLIGSGKLQDTLQQMAEGMDTVHFLGSLSDADLRAALQECDFLVPPSVANSEAFGLVQLEAMVYGKPVINTALPTGVPHVSLDGETGLTVLARIGNRSGKGDANAGIGCGFAEKIRSSCKETSRNGFCGRCGHAAGL